MQQAEVAPGDRLGRLVARLDRWLTPIERAFNLIAAWCIFALMLIGVAQVLGRKILNMPVFGYIDLIEISMATFAFLGIAWCEHIGGHVRMELVLSHLPDRLRYLLEVFGMLVALFLIGVLDWYSYEHFLRAFELGDSTIDAEYPLWPSKLLVPVSFTLLWLRLFVHLLGYARLFVDPGAEPVAVPTLARVEELAREEIREVFGGEEPAETGRCHG